MKTSTPSKSIAYHLVTHDKVRIIEDGTNQSYFKLFYSFYLFRVSWFLQLILLIVLNDFFNQWIFRVLEINL